MSNGRTFRVFVSSTFSDMVAEREALRRDLFPRLASLCQERGYRFQAIDLRWGVSREAAEAQRTLSICLEEVGRCRRFSPRPNFILLLGDRYGWRPVPEQIPAHEMALLVGAIGDQDDEAFIREWYRLDENSLPAVFELASRGDLGSSDAWPIAEARLRDILARAVELLPPGAVGRTRYVASATHQEILEGLLDVPDAAEHVTAVFRRCVNLPVDAAEYRDLGPTGQIDEKAADALENLITSVSARLSEDRVLRYQTTWSSGRMSTRHLTELCEDLFAALSRQLIDEMACPDLLSEEIASHASVMEEHCCVGLERPEDCRPVADYLAADSSRELHVVGDAGCGKSWLLAHAAVTAAGEGSFVVYRSVGASHASVSLATLLQSIHQQLCRLDGADEREATPIPAPEIHARTAALLRRIDSDRDERLVLVVDGLDRLDEAFPPIRCNRYVRVVTSAQRGGAPRANVAVHAIGPFDIGASADLIRSRLAWAGRCLRERQEQVLVRALADRGSPRDIWLACQIAQGWRSWEVPTPLPRSTEGLARRLVGNLERFGQHGPLFVERVFSLLGLAREGLSESELLDLLSADREIMEELRVRYSDSPTTDRFPEVLWARLLCDIQSLLVYRESGGARVLVVRDPALKSVIEAAVLSRVDVPARHRQLAEYFGAQPNWWGRAPDVVPNARRAIELTTHLERSGDFDGVSGLLEDLDFLSSKCASGRVFAVASH